MLAISMMLVHILMAGNGNTKPPWTNTVKTALISKIDEPVTSTVLLHRYSGLSSVCPAHGRPEQSVSLSRKMPVKQFTTDAIDQGRHMGHYFFEISMLHRRFNQSLRLSNSGNL